MDDIRGFKASIWRSGILKTDASQIADPIERDYLLFQQQCISIIERLDKEWFALREEISMCRSLVAQGEMGTRVAERTISANEKRMAVIDAERKGWTDEAVLRDREMERLRKAETKLLRERAIIITDESQLPADATFSWAYDLNVCQRWRSYSTDSEYVLLRPWFLERAGVSFG